MKKQLSTILTITIALTALVVISGTKAYAANEGAGQALEIAPPVLTMTANPGDTINTQIQLRDVSTSPLIVTSAINDFAAQGESGEPKIDVDNTETSPYSIKAWVKAFPQLNMKSQETQKLPVVINVPKNAAPGGYWGVVRFTASPPGIDGQGVSLAASLGSLVFVRVNGDAKENMSIEQFYASEPGKDSPASLFESTPLDFVLRIKNNGNVHEQPMSQVRIKDMFGKDVGAVNINLEGKNVLPGSIRKFSAPLDKGTLGTRMLFGKYTAEITTTYGSGTSKQTVTQKLDFWVIPYRLIILIIAGLILLFFILRAVIRNYNRRITRRVRTSRR
jgi:hypothetical protein